MRQEEEERERQRKREERDREYERLHGLGNTDKFKNADVK